MVQEKQKIDPKIIDSLCAVLGNMGNVPEGFCEDFRIWALDWHSGRIKKESVSGQWVIERRPYKITELAKIPGMPGRTKLHEIIKRIPLKDKRNESGQLRPVVVEEIVKRLHGGRNTEEGNHEFGTAQHE